MRSHTAAMPSTPPLSSRSTAARPPGGGAARWLREPLLHFVLLGALLFAADHLINARGDDPHTLYVDAAVDAQARKVFRDARGREPNADELYALRRVWLDNEVLYREGLALQVDKGDTAIRERVIFKALSIVDAGLKPPPHDDRLVRDYFEQHRVKYDEPARYDFDEAVLAGPPSEAAALQFARSLQAGTPGDAQAGLRVFKDRPQDNLVQSYGDAFVQGLAQAPSGQWQALQGKDGWHVVRLASARAAKPAVFDDMAGVVRHDWVDAYMAQQRSDAVRTLAKKYSVKLADGLQAAEHAP